MARLEGKIAIITGAARGMGESTARLFIREGAKVILGDIMDDAGEQVANELGPNAAYVHLDVTNEEDWKFAINKAEEFGPLNILVNNAAILHVASLINTTPKDYQRVIKVNQFGTFLGIHSVIPFMIKGGGGSIINISSIDGLQAKNGLSAYVSSKWAVRGLTKAAAIELGPYNIRVNSVHPGGIDTSIAAGVSDVSKSEMNQFYKNHPIPRVGAPIEVANVNLFLASDESSYCTGAEFLADGGWAAGLRTPVLPTT